MNNKERALGIGGNHLASVLLAHGIHPAEYDSAEEIIQWSDHSEREFIELRDVWIGWKAIMDAVNG